MTAAAKETATGIVTSATERLLELSHQIHGHPETAFEETVASRLVSFALKSGGLSTRAGAYGLATAFEAAVGDGPLEVVLCAEYDALPGLGHACGHNIIAAASVGAALALAPLVDDLGVTLRVLGTPAEEGGGGKVTMLENGAFVGAHAALMIHPGPIDLPYMPSLATTRLGVTYLGAEAHASAFPERGINAADAALLAQAAIAMARQQMAPGTKVHGIVTRAGDAPNVIPGLAELDYLIRAPDGPGLDALEAKVGDCFQAAAIATGCTVTVERTMPVYLALQPDPDLTRLYTANAETLGRRVEEVTERVRRASGSTDMGNVSCVVPSIHPMIGLGKGAGTIHSPGFTEAARSAAGDSAVIDGAIALAHTVIDLSTDVSIRERLLRA